MANKNNVEVDVMWEAIQKAFPPDEAIYFRNYLIKVENSVREIDYFVFHRSGTAFIITVPPIAKRALRGLSMRISDKGVVFFLNNVSNEPQHYEPTAIVRHFFSSLRQQNVPINNEKTIIWLANSNENFIIPSNTENEVVIVFGSDINNLQKIFELKERRSDQEWFTDQQWFKLKERISPSSPIQSQVTTSEQRSLLALTLFKKYKHLNKNASIFISYRREDAGWAAGRIYSHLSSEFRLKKTLKALKGDIFFDRKSIELGEHWKEVIDQAIEDSIIQLVVIGPKWAKIKTPGKKKPRIFEDGDMVAHEIQTALDKKKKIIPLLIDDIQMPREHELPSELKMLSGKQAIKINQDDYFAKMDVLVDNINEFLHKSIGIKT